MTGTRRLLWTSWLVGALPFSTSPLKSQDWQSYKPSLVSRVARLEQVQAESLLSHFCVAITKTKDFGLTCETRHSGPELVDIRDHKFHPEGVIFGHFLASGSEDAAVSGWSSETHPSHWGGTLLLTRNDGTWRPVWYKSGLITRSCAKTEQADGREVLICEFEDGGMGHRYHSLFGIDLLHPSTKRPLAEADSFESDFCTGQRQVMDSVIWGIGHRSLSVVIRTTEWYKVPSGACPRPPRRPPAKLRLEFDVTVDGVRLKREGDQH